MEMLTNRRVMLVGSYAPSLINFRGPLIRDMLMAGHEVIATAPDMTPDIADALTNLGAEVYETPLRRSGISVVSDIRYMMALRTLIRKTVPDLVITYTIKPNIWGTFAARANGVRAAAMVTGLGYAFGESSSAKRRVIRAMATRLYRMATDYNEVVVFQNPDDRDDFVAAGCLSDIGKARMVNGSGVDMIHYAPAQVPDAPIFLMVSRLMGDKGVREYAAAAIAAKRERPHASFRLAGWLDEGLDAIPRAELNGWIEAGLEYLGPLSDVRPALAEASVFVLPSYREGTPRSVLEAMAMGRAILTSDTPGCRETVVDGKNGWLTPPRDVQTLTELMIRMVDAPETRQAFGKASLRLATKKYEVGRVNAALMNYLRLATPANV